MKFRKTPPNDSGWYWWLNVDHADPQIGFYLSPFFYPLNSGRFDVNYAGFQQRYWYGDKIEKPDCVSNIIED